MFHKKVKLNTERQQRHSSDDDGEENHTVSYYIQTGRQTDRHRYVRTYVCVCTYSSVRTDTRTYMCICVFKKIVLKSKVENSYNGETVCARRTLQRRNEKQKTNNKNNSMNMNIIEMQAGSPVRQADGQTNRHRHTHTHRNTRAENNNKPDIPKYRPSRHTHSRTDGQKANNGTD